MEQRQFENKQNLLDEEDMKRKIENAETAQFVDVTLEELKQEWLKTSGVAGRHDAPPDAQEKAHAAKKKYFEALEKESGRSF